MAEPEDDLDRELRRIRQSMNAKLARASRKGCLSAVLEDMDRRALADWKGPVLKIKAPRPLRRRKKA